jgi:hypothetical protein
MYSIRYSGEAREDILEIVIWYRTQQEGLEEAFLTSLKSAIKLIEKNPLLFQVVVKAVRCAILYKFP